MNRASTLPLLMAGLLAVAALLFAGTTPSPLIDLRIGPHKSFDRIVFEFPHEVSHEISVTDDHTIQVRFQDAKVGEGFAIPKMPRGLTILSSVKMQPIEGNEIIFDVQLARDASPTELTLSGSTWRLALDFLPRVSEQPADKPEYIPGDRPIPTTFAETEPASTDTIDPAQSHAILAYFFFSRGDTVQAAREAMLYQELTGTAPRVPVAQNPTETPKTLMSSSPERVANFRFFSLSLSAMLGIMFGVGLVIGLLAARILPHVPIRMKIPLPHIKLRFPAFRRRAKESPDDVTEELEEGLSALDSAVKQEEEQPRSAQPKASKPEPKPAPEPEPAPVPDGEAEAKENLMDRRVKKVLELSKGGRSVADIAEELQMGQDEVKLILDLNRK